MSGPWEKFQAQSGPWSKFQPQQSADTQSPELADVLSMGGFKAGMAKLGFGAVGSVLDSNPQKALLTNEPVSGLNAVIRGAPASIGGIIGGGAGLASGGPLGAIAGAGLGAGAFEAARNAGVNGMAAYQGTAPTQPGQVIKNVGTQAIVNAGAEGLGQGLTALKPLGIKVGAAVMRNVAGIPEKSGQAALENLSLLSNAPSNADVSQLYNDFHNASDTVSRDAMISRSANPFDSPKRAYFDMIRANNNLKNGTLTYQEAVNASQAARIIRDAKATGNEFARGISDRADTLKDTFDNWIQTTIAPGGKMAYVPVAQSLVPQTIQQEVAREIVPGTIKTPIAQELLQTGTRNVPSQETQSILPQLNNVVDAARKAVANGLNPKSLLQGDAERALYDQFKPQIDSAVMHRIPIETMLSDAELNPGISGFSEQPTFGPGKIIYGDKPQMFPGKSILGEQTVYKPGEIINKASVIDKSSGRQGFPEYQAARQAAWENAVASDFSHPFPINQNTTSNQLRGYGSLFGAATGIGAGIATGHPGLAAAAAVSPIFQSPMVYGAAIRTANALSPLAEAAAKGIRFAPGSIAAFYNSPRTAP